LLLETSCAFGSWCFSGSWIFGSLDLFWNLAVGI
jgi:hypothetical protein